MSVVLTPGQGRAVFLPLQAEPNLADPALEGSVDFARIMLGRSTLAASLQGTAGNARQNFGESAVAFADVALLQSGVTVRSLAIAAPAPDTLEPTVQQTTPAGARLAVESGPSLSVPAPTLAESRAVLVEQTIVASARNTAAGSKLSATAIRPVPADLAVLAVAEGLVLSDPIEASPVSEAGASARRQTALRLSAPAPVNVLLSDGPHDLAVFVRAEGLAPADEAEFERRLQDELAAAGRNLRQLKINGRNRPATGVE